MVWVLFGKQLEFGSVEFNRESSEFQSFDAQVILDVDIVVWIGSFVMENTSKEGGGRSTYQYYYKAKDVRLFMANLEK